MGFCCCILVIGGYLFYKDYQKKHWKGSGVRKTTAELDAMFGTRPNITIDCQKTSNERLAWEDHQGLTPLQDWAAFNYQYCTTSPVEYTANASLFSSYYSQLGTSSPDNDPALTDGQQVESGTRYIVGNKIPGKFLKLEGNGALSLKNNASGVVDWTTPASSSSITESVLKFDSNNYNSGNLCVFPKGGENPIWCMLSRVSVPTSSCSGSGCPAGSVSGDLQAAQAQVLGAANLKNSTDTASRFVMIDDGGQFCMYRGSPGAIQGSPIICK